MNDDMHRVMTSLLSTRSGKTNSRHWGGGRFPCVSMQTPSADPNRTACRRHVCSSPLGVLSKTLDDDDDDGRRQRRASVCLCRVVDPKACCWSHCPCIKGASSPAVELASGGCRVVLLMLIESTLSLSQSECLCVLSILDPCRPPFLLAFRFLPTSGTVGCPSPPFGQRQPLKPCQTNSPAFARPVASICLKRCRPPNLRCQLTLAPPPPSTRLRRRRLDFSPPRRPTTVARRRPLWLTRRKDRVQSAPTRG